MIRDFLAIWVIPSTRLIVYAGFFVIVFYCGLEIADELKVKTWQWVLFMTINIYGLGILYKLDSAADERARYYLALETEENREKRKNATSARKSR